MHHNLTNDVLTVRSINATAAGTTSVTGASVDMLANQYTSVRAVACLGALTATQVTKLALQESSDNSTFATVAATTTAAAADADSNKMLITDLYRPLLRYVRPIVIRGTANAVIDGVILEASLPLSKPVTADATVSQQLVADYA